MKKLILTILTLPLLCHAEEPGTWVDLFDGKTLDGWIQRGGEAKYEVVDGVIVGTTVPKTPNSFLCTDRDYGNFILEVEYKVDPELNCGIQFRSLSSPDYKDGRVHGYQCEIDPSDRGWSAGIYDEARNGWLDDLSDNPAAGYAFKQDDWNHYRIEAVGNHLRTYINGVLAGDLIDDTTASGFIALQVHGIGNKDETLHVSYRNIRIQDLGPDTDYQIPEKKSYTVDGPLVKEGAEFRTLAEGFKFTEGPALSLDGKIYFDDIPNERTHIYDPETGKVSVYRENTGKANGLFFTPAGALIACEGGNRRVTRTDFTGEVKTIADKFDGKKLNSPNDVTPDRFGGFYFTDPVYGKRDDLELDVEGVYYIGRNGGVTQVASDIERPNGIIISPDAKTLYVSDTEGKAIWAFDITAPGKIENKRKFADVGSDGMTIDKLGNVYVTWEDVIAFSPVGKEVLRLTPPQKPANCLLVGKTLYVTARTGFYAIDLEVEGMR